MPLWRSKLQNVYHECMVCGVRQPLSKLEWQNGLLRCTVNRCVDTAIVGQRDADVVKAVAINRKELQPDSKLVEPTERLKDSIDVLF